MNTLILRFTSLYCSGNFYCFFDIFPSFHQLQQLFIVAAVLYILGKFLQLFFQSFNFIFSLVSVMLLLNFQEHIFGCCYLFASLPQSYFLGSCFENGNQDFLSSLLFSETSWFLTWSIHLLALTNPCFFLCVCFSLAVSPSLGTAYPHLKNWPVALQMFYNIETPISLLCDIPLSTLSPIWSDFSKAITIIIVTNVEEDR